MIIYLVYKGFKGWEESKIPVSAYTEVTRAAQAADRLNLDRTQKEIEDGVEYCIYNRGVPVNA